MINKIFNVYYFIINMVRLLNSKLFDNIYITNLFDKFGTKILIN
jgi:hypothetical protein